MQRPSPCLPAPEFRKYIPAAINTPRRGKTPVGNEFILVQIYSLKPEIIYLTGKVVSLRNNLPSKEPTSVPNGLINLS